MKYALLASALLALSSTAQARITDLICTDDHDSRHFSISADDERGRATVTSSVRGEVYPNRVAVFTADQVHIDWDYSLVFDIDRSTLRYHAGSTAIADAQSAGSCRIVQHANRKF